MKEMVRTIIERTRKKKRKEDRKERHNCAWHSRIANQHLQSRLCERKFT
jgi:hypothetical protein